MARELTGRKVFAITAGAFGVIIAVNGVMAWAAVNTFPGLEVRNSYIASQGFNDRLAAQRALGWSTAARLGVDSLSLTITGPDGAPAAVQAISATLSRPTHQRDDMDMALAFDGEAYVAPVTIAPGHWNLEFTAIAADGTEFRQRIGLVRE